MQNRLSNESKKLMKSFFNTHPKSLIIQFLLIIIILAIYFTTPKQFISSVNISPVFNTLVIESNSNVKLSKIYTSNFVFNMFFSELSNAETRDEIYNEFSLANDFNCDENFIEQPSMQFYQKQDNSFPSSGRFTTIQVKSYCKEIPQKFLIFLTNRLEEKIIEIIQKSENEHLDFQSNMLILENKNDLKNIKIFFSSRKELLQRIIPFLKKDEENSIDSNKSLTSPYHAYNFDAIMHRNLTNETFNLNVLIPLSSSAAEAELEFILSMTDLQKSSIGMINRSSLIEQLKIKYDFSNYILVNVSAVGNLLVSKRNLFLTIFSIFIIIALGFVTMLLTSFNSHKKLQ